MKRTLLAFLTLITFTSLVAQVPSYVPTDSLQGWWPFNGNANDQSVKKNNGVVTGAVLSTDRFGNSNSCYSFDGVGDYINCGSSNSLKITKSMSISVWIYANNFNTDHGIVSNYNSGGGYDLVTSANNSIPPLDKVRWMDQGGFLFSNSINSGKWYHLVVVFDAVNKKKHIYIDGKLNTTGNSTLSILTNTTLDFYIGAHQPNNVNYWSWDGKLDDVGIWNRVLNECEISQLFLSKIITPTISIGSNTQTHCGKDSALISATTGFKTYSWSNGRTGRQVYAKQTGYLSVIATDSLGCKAYDTALLSIQKPRITPRDTVVCNGTAVTLTAKGLTPTGCSTMPPSLQSGLVGCWPFCGNANDISGKGNHGTVNGAALANDRFGNPSSAYSFNGITDVITVAHNSILNFENKNAFTLSYWINPKTISSTQNNTIIIKQTGGGTSQDGFNSNIEFNSSSNYRIQNGVSTPSYNAGSSSNSIITGKWKHVIHAWNGSEGKIYLDGVLVFKSVGTAKVGDNTSDLYFGKPLIISSTGTGYNGVLDEIGIWDRNLSQNEINLLYSGIQYTWSTKDTGTTAKITAYGKTTIWVKSDDGIGTCYDTTTISIANPTVSIGANTQTHCGKDSALISASTGFKTYSWSNGKTGREVYAKQTGDISVIATDSLGCKAYDTALLSIQKPRITPRDTMVCTGAAVNLSVKGVNPTGCSTMPLGLQSGLVGWWPFCGNANDESGNGNHGTVNGATVTTDRFGNAKSSYDFNGINNYIDLGTNFNQTKFTLCAWINMARLPILLEEWAVISKIKNYNLDYFKNYEISLLKDGQINTTVPVTKWENLLSKTKLTANTWHFITVSYDGSYLKLYIDGTKDQDSIWGTYSLSNTPLYIGARPNNSGTSPAFFFNGKIDDVGVWNRSLTSSEIKSLYDSKEIVYTWSTKDTGTTAKITATGKTTVWVKSYDGIGTCYDTTTISIANPTVSFGANTQTHCGKDSTLISATAGFKTYSWSNGKTGRQVYAKQTGYLSVIATDSLGCKAYDTALLSIQKPRITPRDTVVCNGAAVNLSVKGINPTGCSTMPPGLQSGLVGWWPFCGNANDESGNGNNGTVNGATLTKDRFGNADKAYDFDGINDYVELNNNNNLSNLNNLTISLWLSINSYGSASQSLDYSTIFMKSDPWYSANGYSLLLNRDVNNVSARGINLNIAGSSPYFFPYNWQISKWYHVVVIVNNNNASLYVNNTFIKSFSGVVSIPTNNSNFILANGNKQIPASYLFPGKIDDIGLWNRALTKNEMNLLYSGTQYTWSTKDTGTSAKITATGKTTVWVKSDDGIGSCYDTTTINISNPTVSIGSNTQTHCGKDSVQISATTGFKTYSWSNGKTGRQVHAKQTGYLSVIATDSFGCSAKDTALFSIQKPRLSPRDTVNCSGTQVNLAVKGLTKNSCINTPYGISNGLLGWWPLCGNANDASNNNNHGTEYNVTYGTDRFGNANAACNFNGTSTRIEVPATNKFDVTNFSLSVWINVNGGSSVINKSNWSNATAETFNFGLGGPNSLNVSLKKNSSCVTGAGWNNFSASTGATSLTNNWNHAVLTYNGSNLVFYLNGKVISNQSFSGPLDICSGGQIKFGAWWQSNPDYFKGLLDDIGIWNRALTNNEVALLYNNPVYTWSTSDTANTTLITANGKTTVWVKSYDGIGTCYDTTTVSISKPVVSITLTDSVNCYNGNDGNITSKASNGISPYNYQWNDASKQTTAKANNLGKGTYRVVVTDAVGCKDSATATVNEPAKVSISITAVDSVNCFNGSDGSITTSIAGGSGGIQYNWNDAAKQTSSKAVGLQKGTYKVIAKDIYGCSDSATATVNEPAKVSISITAVDSVNCFNGSDGSITTSIAGGSGGIQYSWNDAAKQTTSKGVGLQKGTYKVIAKDIYGCSDSATATVNEPAKVSISITAVDSVNCFNGSDGSISTAITGGSGGIQYSWNDAATQTTSKAVGLQKGTYKVVAKDIYGCSDSATATVNEPAKVSISITAVDSVNCFNGSDGSITTAITGGSGGIQYNWNDAAKQTTSKGVGLQKGTYKVIAKDIYGCSDSATATVNEPAKVSISITAVDSVNCFNGSDGSITTAITGGSGGIQYSWNDAAKQTTSKAVGLQKGTYKVVAKDIYGCSDSATATVNEPAKVSISITAVDSVNCFNGSDGSITTSIAGGSGGIQYSWNDAAKQTTSKAVGLQKGTYKVIAKDIYGCSDSATATVNEPAKVSLSITAVDSVNCFNGSDGSISTAITGGSGGIQYSWNDAAKQTTSKGVGLQKGTYKVVAKDIYGCSDSATATVNEPAKVSISITAVDSVNCFNGSDGSISTSITGGSGGIKYSWNDAAKQTTSKAVGLQKGTYKVIAKDIYGCSDSTTATVNEPAKVVVSLIENDSVNCFNGSDGRLSANISGGSGGYRYQWNDPLKRQSSSINNLKKGSYKVLVKDLYGCTDSLVAMMNEPAKVSISITAVDSVNCFNGSDGSITTAITGGSGGIQYNWNDAAKQTTSKAVGLQKGTYKVIAKDIYGCSDSATATVNEPAKVSISITAVDSVNCFNGSDGSITTAITGGSGGIQYSWNDAAKQTTSKAVNLKKGTYKVIAKDIYGCSDSAITAVKEPLKVSISITKIDSVTCYRYKDARIFTQTKGGTGKYSWTWDDSAAQITANAVGLKKGTYKVLVKDVYGCKDSLRVTLGEPLEIIPKIIANRLTMKDKFTNINSIVNPGGQYTYSWTPSSLFAKTSGNTSQKVIINDSTRVFLNVTDSKGCLGKDSFDIIVVQSLKDIIPNAFTPTEDGLNEEFGLPDIFEIQTFDVYDRWGGLIFRGGPNQPKWNGKIGAELVPAGNYAYTISAILKGTGQNVRHAGTVILIR